MTDSFSRRDVLKAGAAAVAASFSPLALAQDSSLRLIVTFPVE